MSQFIIKILNTGQYPNYKIKLLQNKVDHDYNTRNRTLLRPLFEQLKKFMTSFFNNGIRVWNIISEFVKMSKTIRAFKIKMKNWLLHNT